MTHEQKIYASADRSLTTIFLDFDGVLHPVGAQADRLFEKAGLLAEVLKEQSNTEVVISSSWAAYRSLQQIKDLLKTWPALTSLIAGKTQQRLGEWGSQSDFPERETQCLDWLISNERSLYRWIAIDDDIQNFATRERLLHTKSTVGLTPTDLAALQRMLLGAPCR